MKIGRSYSAFDKMLNIYIIRKYTLKFGRAGFMEETKEVYEFYNSGAEIGRLSRGLGKIEFYRTKEILRPYFTKQSVVYDIGGGIGIYSDWLAGLGQQVQLFDLADSAVEYARGHQSREHPYLAEVCDARQINRGDESADVILLMGPVYHLQNVGDRLQVMKEAHRVLKKGGMLFTTGISKFSNTTWALSTYGMDNEVLDDSVFREMIYKELASGKHDRPKEYPNFIAQSYFHTPDQLQKELESVGFQTIKECAIEGVIWITPRLEEKWENEDSRNILLQIIKKTESEDSVMGMSPHFMIISKK